MAEERVVQVAVSKEIRFLNCHIEVRKTEGGGRELLLLDPVAGTAYLLPMNAETARKIGNELFSAVPVAQPGDIPGATP